MDLNSKTVTEIGTLGGNYSYATGINESGQVVGYSQTAGGLDHAFITGPNGVGMRDLGTLGGNYSGAAGINDSGQAVGYSGTAGAPDHAFITGPNGVGMRDLGTLNGTDYSSAYGVNDAGQVIGVSYSKDRGYGFITGPNGMGMRDLGTLGVNSSPTAINNAGQVVGSFTTAEGTYHSFITGPNGMDMRDFGTVAATGINDTGQVTGSYSYYGDAFITGPNGMGMRDLGNLSSIGFRPESGVYDINDAGQVVGYTRDGYRGFSIILPFITGPNGMGMADLNSLVHLPAGVTLTEAHGINNVGQIIAIGVIPEPEISALLLSGLALVGFVARRKKGIFPWPKA